MQEHEINYGERRIFYRLSGSGHPVMLLHGFGEDGEVWKEQYQKIEGFQFIIPDLPGSGRSPLSEDVSMDAMADHVHAVLSHSGSSSCIIIGHSMGGYVALAFAERFPESISGLGLFHSTAYADSEEKKGVRRKGIDFIRKNGASEFLNTATPNLFSPHTLQHQPALVTSQLQAGAGFTDSALIAYYDAMMQRPDRTHILKNSTVPVLFILGRHDTAVPLPDGLEQSHLPDRSFIHILENSGHMGMLEETGKSNAVLRGFLASVQELSGS